MHVCVFTLIGVIFAVHASCEAAKETPASASSNHESLHETAPSRVKRGSYDMLRLTRGLHMLRLGKRAGSIYNPDSEPDQILTLEGEYPESYLYQRSLDDYYKALAALDGEYDTSRGLRYRRSTPSDDQMVTPVPSLEGEDDVIEDDNMKLSGDLGDVYPSYYPKWDYALVDDGHVDEIKPKRQLQMLRLGKREDEDLKRSLDMLRLGKRQDEDLNTEFTDSGEKRSLEMLRLGKKRNLNMLRLGKRDSEDEKRNLNMLRLGKRQLNMLRLGKRQLNMLRLGKRQLNMLRLGKRQLNMLRLGKRQLNMLRLGKKSDEKRNLHMLRLGKRSVDDELDKKDV